MRSPEKSVLLGFLVAIRKNPYSIHCQYRRNCALNRRKIKIKQRRALALEKIINKTIECLENGQNVVWAAVVEIKGSTPRKVASRMMITGSGEIEGSVGGGRMEGEVIERAEELLKEPGCVLFSVSLTGKDVAETKMICGGRIKLHLETLTKDDLHFVNALKKHIQSRRNPILVTMVDEHSGQSPSRHLLTPGGESIFSNTDLQQETALTLESLIKENSLPRFVEDDAKKVAFFAESLKSPDRLFIFGGGHVALEIAWIGERSDFQIHVWDDREDFANGKRFPMAAGIYTDPCEQTINSTDFGPNDYVVIVTRGHLFDLDVLRHVIRKSPRYIGLIGSRRKRTMIYDQLAEEGIARERLEKVHSPIGLPIKAETPAELAVSIVGELIQVRAE